LPIVPLNLNANYELGGTIGNSVDTYTNLAFRVYPSGTTSYGYFEDSANQTRTITSTENFAGHQVTVSVPPLSTKSTLQVASSKPTSVTKDGVTMTAHATLAALQSASEGWYWDPVQQLTLVKTASSAAARSVVLNGVDKAAYEAEFGTNTGTTTNTDHAGYTGTGFVDGFETSGDAVSVDTQADVTGSHVLKFRYSNGAATTATRTIQVDGVTVGTLNLPTTGNWDTWSTATLTTTLTTGKRTVKAIYGTGGINLDNITVARP